MNPARKRLIRLRALMKERGIDACIFPNTDPHLGEYIPDHWKIVQWLTGFSGSAATVLVTKSFAGLWTDSRYFLQATTQLDGSGYEMIKTGTGTNPSINGWLSLNFKKGGIIAFDGRLTAISSFRQMKNELEGRLPVFITDADLVSDLWEGRPPLPESVAFEHSPEFAGIDRESKIARVREEMRKRDLDYHLLTSPDDIMWLLNIRANDVKYTPLLLSFAIVKPDQVILFADESRIPPRVAREFDQKGIVILPYDEVASVLYSLPEFSSLLISPNTTTVSLFNSINEKVKIIENASIPAGLKAVKNDVEKENIRNVMVRDGVALTRFFFWLDHNLDKESVTETGASVKLKELRLQQVNCTGESFGTIMAYNEHGALPHYSPDSSNETVIRKEGVLLVDSGGQYLDGTTDITRCIALGRAPKEQKTDFTLALKGMITLAMARFPQGTRGYQLDVLARKAMWDRGLDYGHGTGHGVGFYLNVHEGPQAIGPSSGGTFNTSLAQGMIISDEPAIYREGKYGFRTENLLLVTGDILTEFGQFLRFETLSLCFIDISLIDRKLLDEKEVGWLNAYHSRVYEKLMPFLSDDERKWLRQKTIEI